MAKIRTIQIYRGTTAQNDAYTGSAGELTMDTTTNTIRIHDGSTQGGHAIGGSTPGGSGTFNLFDFKWADYELGDMAWLRGDTFSWQSGSVYQVAYQHLADDISGKSLSSETIAGVTVQFYLADDGHKICPASEESNVVSIYNVAGIAWYYILDTVNQRFKLPRTKYGFTGLRDTVGNYVEAGLPNITGTFAADAGQGGFSASGAFYTTTGTSTGRSWDISDTTNYAMDASLSSSVYGNSNTVQPPATQMYLYFYVGEFTQTALENTAGLNASLFNGKADIDLTNAVSNASSVAKETIVGWGLPDYSAGINVTSSLFNNKSYTAPSKGVLFNAMIPTYNTDIKINGNSVGTRLYSTYGNWIPTPYYLNKGDIFSVSGWIGNSGGAYFFPLKGVN